MEVEKRDLAILEKIDCYCAEIQEAHAAFDKNYDAFLKSSIYRNAVCLCLMQIGELTGKLSDVFKTEHPDIPWRAIRGMRNVVAHEYGRIDVETVWETAEDGVSELRDFCRKFI